MAVVSCLLACVIDDFAQPQIDLHRALSIWVGLRASSFDVTRLCWGRVRVPHSPFRYANLV